MKPNEDTCRVPTIVGEVASEVASSFSQNAYSKPAARSEKNAL